MKTTGLALLLSLTLGCGFAERHPTQAKVYALIGGAAAGAGIGLATRGRGPCVNYIYDGKPYSGNPCPADAYKPKFRRGQ